MSLAAGRWLEQCFPADVCASVERHSVAAGVWSPRFGGRSELRDRYCNELQVSQIASASHEEYGMSKAFIASVLQDSAELTGVAANRAASDLIDAIVKQLKTSAGFTLPSFGTFRVVKTKARKGLNPRTGEPVKIKAGKTVRFKASPTLKKAV